MKKDELYAGALLPGCRDLGKKISSSGDNMEYADENMQAKKSIQGMNQSSTSRCLYLPYFAICSRYTVACVSQ